MATHRTATGGAVLVVAMDDAEVAHLVVALGSRGFGARTVPTLAEASRALHFENVVAAFVRGDDAAALLAHSLDVPVVAVGLDPDGVAARELLRAGVTAVIATTAEREIAFALERAIPESPTPASEDPPPPPPVQHGLLGESELMRRVLELVDRVAPLLATALVRGETGTGKELVARALHERSPRAQSPFVKVHCAALPDALLESELFGYEKGAFTGASVRKPGRVDLAEGGTLFLDEIGDVTPAVQVKLLRLLQDKEYERLGGVQALRADVRFIAATHRNLEDMVKKGEFREDLFYRLNVVTLWLPPLRARRDDIPILAREFARQFAGAYAKPDVHFDGGAISALRGERWPGNVRQLQNFVERLVVLSARPAVTAEDVQRELAAHTQFRTQLTGVSPSRKSESQRGASEASGTTMALDEAVRRAERTAVEVALRHAGGNRTVAARILGISRATLYAKLDEYGLGR